MYTEKGFVGIPGVPDGWEFVGIRPVRPGEWRLMDDGSVMQWKHREPSIGWAVVLRKIGPKYRSFANAQEFKPHRDRWVTRVDISDDEAQPGACRVIAYDDQGVWWNRTQHQTWKASFDAGRCFDDNGTPFGVQIDE